MEITRVLIKNFRSIKEAEITLGHCTVLIGPNNVGKTAILDAIRIALTRRWGSRGTGFTEGDIHLPAGRINRKVRVPSMQGAQFSGVYKRVLWLRVHARFA